MRTFHWLAPLLLAATVCASCVSQRVYADEVAESERLREQVQLLRFEVQRLTREVEDLRRRSTPADAGFSGSLRRDIDARAAQLDALLARLGLEEASAEVFELEDGVGWSLTEAALFGLGTLEVSSSGRELLEGIAADLDSFPHVRLWVRGHADVVAQDRGAPGEAGAPADTPRGPLELSVARAIAVADILVGEESIDASRVAVAGFGPHLPITSDDSFEGRAMNRRIEIYALER